MAIRPGAFDERAAGAAVAGLGDPALPPRRPARVLRRRQADERGALPRIVEPREVAELGDDGDRDEPLDAAKRLQRLDHGIQPPRGSPLEQFGLQAMEPIDLFIDGADRFLKDDLLRRCGADDLREITTMGVVPVGAPS